MALLFAIPRVSTIDLVGVIAPRARLYFYQTGTSTPQAVYSDSGLMTPIVQPVQASDAGLFPAIYLNDTLGVPYKVVCSDENDSELWTVDPYLVGPSQAQLGRVLYPRTTAEQSAGVTPTYYYYPPGDVRRYGYIADGVDGTNSGTNNTTALQNALDANDVVRLPAGVALFTNLTVPPHRTIIGEGPRSTVLRQISTSTGYALEFQDAASTDIAEGAFRFDSWCLKVATGSHGVHMADINGSMFMTDQFRLVSQHAEGLGSPPYTTTSNQRGIWIETGGTGSVFFANHRNLEIRSFDIAIDADDTVNEWTIHGWILDCRVAIRLTDSSTWDMSGLTIETGVQNARALQTFGACSNLKWCGGRWELTQSGGVGVEGDGSTTGNNWRFAGINVLINGDGSAIPGLKWSGTVPNDFIFEGYDASPLPFIIIPNLVTMRLPNLLTLGGTGLGNALITLGRNSGGAACTIGHDGTHMEIKAGNSLELFTGGTLPAATLDDSIAAGETRLLVYDVDNGQVERVTVGDPDSGGTGFKVLRIPN